jgi:hypothetical protein
VNLPAHHPLLFEVADDGELLGVILPARPRPRTASVGRPRSAGRYVARRRVHRVAHGSKDPPDHDGGRNEYEPRRETSSRSSFFVP